MQSREEAQREELHRLRRENEELRETLVYTHKELLKLKKEMNVNNAQTD